jgi:thiol-disulfide isomerase/thioredoxin
MTSSPGDRRARRAARRAEARRTETRRSNTSRWLLPGLIGAVVVAAAVIAFVLPGLGGPAGGGSSTLPPGSSGGPTSGAGGTPGVPAVTEPVISGTSLPAFEGPANDAAVGMAAPTVEGSDFDGEPVAIAADGRAKVILFLAHWCPHCQAEVPVMQTWANAGGVPDGVDVISVATAIDPAAPNYPPDAWLEREGWTLPVIVDPSDTVSNAYGLTAFPFWVFVGPDGDVRARMSGELSAADLEAAIRGMSTTGEVAGARTPASPR